MGHTNGGLAERSKAPHSKCGFPETGSQVQILYPPPIGKRSVWLARCEGSPADFKRKIEFFVFQNKVRADIFQKC